jgi:hypothetical protein
MKLFQFLKYSLVILISFLSCSDGNVSDSSGTPLPTNPPVVLTDEQLLTQVQRDAFKYFWDYAEPNSKLARERYHVDESGCMIKIS